MGQLFVRIEISRDDGQTAGRMLFRDGGDPYVQAVDFRDWPELLAALQDRISLLPDDSRGAHPDDPVPAPGRDPGHGPARVPVHRRGTRPQPAAHRVAGGVHP